jgi:hypothetical protein
MLDRNTNELLAFDPFRNRKSNVCESTYQENVMNNTYQEDVKDKTGTKDNTKRLAVTTIASEMGGAGGHN